MDENKNLSLFCSGEKKINFEMETKTEKHLSKMIDIFWSLFSQSQFVTLCDVAFFPQHINLWQLCFLRAEAAKKSTEYKQSYQDLNLSLKNVTKFIWLFQISIFQLLFHHAKKLFVPNF
jgi:hypothetical protein